MMVMPILAHMYSIRALWKSSDLLDLNLQSELKCRHKISGDISGEDESFILVNAH
jgi:hypothetical protein